MTPQQEREHKAWTKVVMQLLDAGAVTASDGRAPVGSTGTSGQRLYTAIREWGEARLRLRVHRYIGIPPIQAVIDNESFHESRRSGGGEIMLSRVLRRATHEGADQHDETEIVYPKADGRVYGEWLVQHRGGALGDYLGVNNLKVVDGEILYSIGFTQWGRLSDCVWAERSTYLAIDQSGLPSGYVIHPKEGK